MTTPGNKAVVQIQSGRAGAGAGSVRSPARLPETHRSRARQQELLGRMNQTELLSVLHIAADLLKEILNASIYLENCANAVIALNNCYIYRNEGIHSNSETQCFISLQGCINCDESFKSFLTEFTTPSYTT